MGPTEFIIALLGIALGGGLGSLIKSVYDAKAISRKLGPEIESLTLSSMEVVVGGQSTHIGNLQKSNEALRAENRTLERRSDVYWRWIIDLVTNWAARRQSESPPPLPEAEE